MKITSPQFGDGSGMFYSYMNVQPDQVETLGYAYSQNGTPVIDTETAGDIVPMPLTYGTTWSTTAVDTISFGDFGLTIDEKTIKNTIDGWGTVRVPAGDNQGNPLPSGIYFYMLSGSNFSKMQKLTLIR
jgi:hypothetical protein